MTGDLSSRPRHAPGHPVEDADGLRRARMLRRGAAGSELLEALRATDSETLNDQIEVTRVPAPPVEEARRAAWMRDRFASAGLREVGIDAIGNVTGLRPAGRGGAPIVLSAHLDTVFPAETPIRVRREGDRIFAPGISDDGRGLAALLAILRVLNRVGTPLRHPLLFAATVGEEGVGDLRGVRGLFGTGGAARDAIGFVSLDGAGTGRVVTSGVGSRRYRIRVCGPGGHSWADWGRPNPIAILARGLGRLPSAPEMSPGTTWSAGRIGGGTSVNAIPEEAWVEVETRAERPRDLDRIAARVRESFARAVREANRASPGPSEPASLEVRTIGDRPAGTTPPEHPLVRAAVAATRSLDLPVELGTSSTDANLPMSLGVPAITLGAGGEAGGAHTLKEWYRNTRGPEGIWRALATLLLFDEWVAERASRSREAAD